MVGDTTESLLQNEKVNIVCYMSPILGGINFVGAHYGALTLLSIPAPFEPVVRTLRATIPALGASIPVIGNHHSG